jgi:hypothetical protein
MSVMLSPEGRGRTALTLLVKSKTRGKAVLQSTFDGQSDQGHASGEAHAHSVGDQLL